MSSRAAGGAAGFTLLEILVAVTLLGLLMAALFGGVQLGVRAWESSEQRLDESSRLTTVQDFLRARLAETQPPLGFDLGSDARLGFHGEADRLSFVTLMPEHLGAGFQRMVLAVTAAGEGLDLTIDWWPSDLEDAADAATDEVHSRVLLAQVAELRLAYFGAIDASQPPGWYETWDQPLLPLLVRVQVGFPDQDARRWPDLIVRPMIDGQSY